MALQTFDYLSARQRRSIGDAVLTFLAHYVASRPTPALKEAVRNILAEHASQSETGSRLDYKAMALAEEFNTNVTHFGLRGGDAADIARLATTHAAALLMDRYGPAVDRHADTWSFFFNASRRLRTAIETKTIDEALAAFQAELDAMRGLTTKPVYETRQGRLVATRRSVPVYEPVIRG